jgi:metacaspase-1
MIVTKPEQINDRNQQLINSVQQCIIINQNPQIMKKQALLVGINDYKGINDLQGCINDVTNVRSVLKTFFGYSNSGIRVLTDSRATKENILSRLEKLVKSAAEGDFLIFHFSGHGSQIRDREGDELADHMDEIICPYDMNWDDGFISDDMLRGILQQLKKGVHMEILLDSCHSGTGTREILTGGVPWETVKYRYLKPPVDIECRYLGDEEKLKASKSFRTDKEITLNHILWAGCKDNQTSADAMIDGQYNGAFSYYFCKHVRENSGNISRADLYTRVKNSLKYNHYDQVPQLECKETLRTGNIFK